MIFLKRFVRSLFSMLYRFRGFNIEAVSTPGPVLLIPNHVSWIDWLLLGCILDDDWKFVVSRRVAESSWATRKVMMSKRTFPIDMESPFAVRHMADHLKEKGRLVLFAEGRISDTGSLMKLFDGTGFLLYKTNAKVITCYLRGANRSNFSRHSGWKMRMPEITAHFSEVMEAPKMEHTSTHQARLNLTQWLRDSLVKQQFDVEMEFGPQTALEAVIKTAALRPNQVALEDVTNTALTYRKLLIGVDLFGYRLQPMFDDDEHRVGVLLPNVNVTPIVIMSLWAIGKTPAVLNFSTGASVMLSCAKISGLKRIITSRGFVEKASLDLKPLEDAGVQFIYVEDIRGRIRPSHKRTSFLNVMLDPASVIRYERHQDEDRAGNPAVVLFTSGSEGVPKGVELTHRNLLANIRQILSILDVEDHDRLFNALPIFHSFGLTVGTLLGLVRGVYVFLYPSPLHYRIVPNAVYDRKCTIFLSTNTFLNGYARKAHPYDFRTVRLLIAGAEKLQETAVKTWNEQFGLRVLEGYGATECSPVISANIPMEPKPGTVGRIMPGMEWKLEDVPGVDVGGRLLVRGPNVMKGYINPDANKKFQKLGGWYDTGDIVDVDEFGYVSIRGRLKRFAKVSGEMVSLTAVEDALAGAFPRYGARHQIAIVTQPDAKKGEVLIAVSNDKRLTLKEVRDVIKESGLPNIAAPREVKFLREIPKLGTGKVNHRELEKAIK